MTETIFTNARVILHNDLIDGTVTIAAGTIVDVQPGRSHAPGAIDLAGDYLMPGVVDVHTDNLERQVQPRTNARWPSRSAMMAHDAQCAAAGVTTVLDALCLGDLGFDVGRHQTFLDGVTDLDALADTGLLKSEHFLHLRCEMPAKNVLELLDPVADHARVRMISLMDHSPGVGQYASLDRYRALKRREGLTDDVIERRIVMLTEQRTRYRAANRCGLLTRIGQRDVALASHDDETIDEIRENVADSIMISEFPVTLLAATEARRHGMQVVAGAPNIVRGGSHSGNVGAAELVRARAVDAFASDYVPAALIEAAFLCADAGDVTLPAAIAMLTDVPARMVHLPDRGRIARDLRADLVRVHVHQGMPVTRQVWRAGERVA